MPVDAAFKMKAAAMTCRRRLQCLTRNRLRSIAFTQHSRGNRLYELKYVVKTLAIWKRFVLMQREREKSRNKNAAESEPDASAKIFPLLSLALQETRPSIVSLVTGTVHRYLSREILFFVFPPYDTRNPVATTDVWSQGRHIRYPSEKRHQNVYCTFGGPLLFLRVIAESSNVSLLSQG